MRVQLSRPCANPLAAAMSCIHLHLGQAGIQLGESFWGLAEEEFFVDGGGGGGGSSGSGRGGRARTRMRPGGTAMFHEDGYGGGGGGWARCLAVDSEPKVVLLVCLVR